MAGNKKTSVVQEAKLAELVRVKGERDRFLTEVHERQRIEREQAVNEYEVSLSRLANECRTMGVVHRRIQSVLGLQNWDSYKKLRELTLGALEMQKSAEEMLRDAEIVEILDQKVHSNGGGPWIQFQAEGLEEIGSIWANKSGSFTIDWDWRTVSPSQHDIKVWYSEKFGIGNV